jgi:hypothetical protein
VLLDQCTLWGALRGLLQARRPSRRQQRAAHGSASGSNHFAVGMGCVAGLDRRLHPLLASRLLPRQRRVRWAMRVTHSKATDPDQCMGLATRRVAPEGGGVWPIQCCANV